MASALSEDEFHRMQLQLLELRTVNYQLDDKCKRQERELSALKSQYEVSDKELQKANKVINKSKKAKEFELLSQEIEIIQGKLYSQEEEFRLQNETLMQELGELIKSNERLEKENQQLLGKSPSSSEESPEIKHVQDEVRRLQAQNSALQKNLTASQEKSEEEAASLRQMVADLEAQCFKLSGQRGTPVGAGTEARTVEGESDPEVLSEPPVTRDQQALNVSKDQTDYTQPESDISQMSTSSPSSNHGNSEKSSLHSRLEQQNRVLADLRLNLDTEREEKSILKDQLSTVECQYKEQVKSLQEEVEKLTEKFKKKQESLVQLQEEKELIYTELSNRIEEVEKSKETEVNSFKSQSDRLQQDLSKCNKVLEDYEQKSNVRIHELESLVNTLEHRMNEASPESIEELEEQNVWYQQQLHAANQQLGDYKKARTDLEVKLKETEMTLRKSSDELKSTRQELEQQTQALHDSQKVAEKRKTLLDELAIKYQEEADQHREQVRTLEDSHRAEVDLLTQQLNELKHKSLELEDLRDEMEVVKGQLHSTDNTRGWLERRLNETEDTLNQTKVEHDESLHKLDEEHQQALESLRTEHAQEVQDLESRLTEVKKEVEVKEGNILKLKQEIKDGLGDKKIHEKKGATIIKDLKRQLQQERKRADKMQERLQDFLSDSKSRQSVEELFRSAESHDRYKGDASSVSSWNASVLSRENTLQSPDEEQDVGSSMSSEHADLLQRLANVQQEKWSLEERVSHLESSNACMAEDLLQKTAVIEHYVMESHIESAAQSPASEKISLKRMVDMIKDRGDENLREMNKKLQNMLEETLTKNMHLQKDMETLSQEIVRLSKLGVTVEPPGKQNVK